MNTFNTPVPRKGTYRTQWDFYEGRFDVKDVLSSSISDMDFPIPDVIARALKKRLEHPILEYGRWQHGEYLNAIVGWYYQQYQTDIKLEWITYGPSVIYSTVKAIELLISHGDNVLVFAPVYNVFFDITKYSERSILTASLIIKNEGGYAINWRDFDLKIRSAKMVLLCNSYNPTGAVRPEEELHKVVASCTGCNVWLCSDETHSNFVFNRSFMFALRIKKEKIVISNSISETSNAPALTGSYMISADNNFNHKFRTASRYRDLVNSPSVLNITATIIAYNECEGWLKSLKAYIASNIQLTQQYLNENIPELIVKPVDGYYSSWIDCSATGCPFDEFYSRLIHEGKVGIMAGYVYGTEGESYLHLNLTCGRERLYMGLTHPVSVIRNINQGEQR